MMTLGMDDRHYLDERRREEQRKSSKQIDLGNLRQIRRRQTRKYRRHKDFIPDPSFL